MTNIPTLEEWQEINQKVDNLTVLVKALLLRTSTPSVLKVADIMKLENVSRSQILGKEAYLLPNFGVSEYPDGTKRWAVDTYLKWRQIPLEKRKRMYSEWLQRKVEKEPPCDKNSEKIAQGRGKEQQQTFVH